MIWIPKVLREISAGFVNPRPRPKQERPTEMVYAIGTRDGALIKIGRTRNIAGRLNQLQGMSPLPLRLFWYTPGGAALEQSLHRKYAAYRTHGEWFDFAGHIPDPPDSGVSA